MRVAFDTNVLVYAEGVNGAAKKHLALELLQKIPSSDALIPVQALGELFQVLTKKAGREPARAREAILTWRDSFPVIETSEPVLVNALELAARHRLNIWDGVILSAAAESGCRLLLSEDMQEGFTWRGVTVVNPFARPPHILLEQLLGALP
ncbi:MAG TPA: PIN domain-containing protein [Terriglobales bacterium]|nr:PIN domain-containing protein [Terriglobales bacterium]